MTRTERIDLLAHLGKHLQEKGDYLKAVMHRTEYNNPWFTKENINLSIDAIATHFLERTMLENWVQQYDIPEKTNPKRVGLVLAGNIPLVGFHDILSVFITGHQAVIKLSDKDKFLLPYFFKWMGEQVPASKDYFQVSERLDAFDAVIATGSNNSARYFEAYFGKYPNIIRKNRNSVAVLTGQETEVDIIALGKDIFQYFGLGCRNVSKFFVPEGYSFDFLLETLHTHFKKMVLHSKYKNNFDYNYALHLLNQEKFLSNGCLIFIEDESMNSRIATMHYSYYSDLKSVQTDLQNQAETIQCVVSSAALDDLPLYPYGQAQEPTLMDYADGVDTIDFLLGLTAFS